MKLDWRKGSLLIGVVAVGVLVVVGSVLWVRAFPTKYPERMLAIEDAVVGWFERVTLPLKLMRLAGEPVDESILMPVYGMRVGQVTDTWQSPRGGGERTHEGQDMFASRGTPVLSGTHGYVTRIRTSELGGIHEFVAGSGGRRYYYAHLDRVATGLRVGQEVWTDTMLGFVGNTGNAITTPPHLHFGVYEGREAINPFSLLRNRP